MMALLKSLYLSSEYFHVQYVQLMGGHITYMAALNGDLKNV